MYSLSLKCVLFAFCVMLFITVYIYYGKVCYVYCMYYVIYTSILHIYVFYDVILLIFYIYKESCKYTFNDTLYI